MNDLALMTTDGFAVQENSGASMIIGRMLKFTDGRFTVDKTETLPASTTLVAVGVITAWVKWEDSRPSAHRVTQPGQSHPYRDELGDQDQTEWAAGLNGEPADPWRDTRYLHLINPNTGQDYTFISDSFGGRRAVGDLKQQIANVRSVHPAAVPLVRLASAMMKTRFGQKPRPDFKIVGWRGKQGEAAPSAARASLAADLRDDIPFAPEFR